MASLLLHALLLQPPAPRDAPAIAVPPAVLTLRLQAAPAAPTPPPPLQAATPALRARASAPSPAPQQAEASPAPAAAPPTRVEAPAAEPSWPDSASWQYRLRWREQQGQAWLRWQHDGRRYTLRLDRQLPERALPSWVSEGGFGPQGLQPERFRSEGRRAQLLRPQPGEQDRLSWIWQLAAQARAQTLRPGDRLALQVAGWRGGTQDWQLRVERDPEAPSWLLLRRLPPAGGLAEQRLWLDPARGFLPVRLQTRFDDNEVWDMVLAGDP